MPLLARPFLMPSSTLHPLTPYYATTSPEDTSPLTLGPLPLPKKRKTRGGCFEPRSGQTQTPLSSLNHPERARLMMITRIARCSQW